MKAVIVAGGFIDDKFTLDYIKRENYDLILAVDRGLEFFERIETEIVPDYIVGDFDSVSAGLLAKYESSQIIRLSPMKDDTDTEHALHLAFEACCDCVHIFGGTGTRLDHVLGNLQLLGYGLRKQVECMLIDPHNRIRLVEKETILKREEQFGKYVSLIPYTPKVTGITLQGFLYPLKNHTMSSFYLEDAVPISGVSNEIIENEARISLEEGILVLIESRD